MKPLRITTVLAAAILITAILSPAAWAQEKSEDSWDNLRQLRPGQRIEVVNMKLQSFHGDFGGYSEEAISLRTDQDEVAIPRADVFSVRNRKRAHRGRNALIGLAIGAASGLAVGAVAGATYHEQGETRVFVSVFTPIGAGVGAGVAAAIPAGAVTIYRAKGRSRPYKVGSYSAGTWHGDSQLAKPRMRG